MSRPRHLRQYWFDTRNVVGIPDSEKRSRMRRCTSKHKALRKLCSMPSGTELTLAHREYYRGGRVELYHSKWVRK